MWNNQIEIAIAALVYAIKRCTNAVSLE